MTEYWKDDWAGARTWFSPSASVFPFGIEVTVCFYCAGMLGRQNNILWVKYSLRSWEEWSINAFEVFLSARREQTSNPWKMTLRFLIPAALMMDGHELLNVLYTTCFCIVISESLRKREIRFLVFNWFNSSTKSLIKHLEPKYFSDM